MINKFFVTNNYKSIKLKLSSTGRYSYKDSEWNYSDIPHLNYVHTRVEGILLTASEVHTSSVLLQRIGPFEIPASVNIFHNSERAHTYLITILNIAILVETTHLTAGDECNTTTTYEFFYKGIFGWIVCVAAKFSTIQNYKVLMDEDMPMRTQRGILRSRGVTFELDEKNLIGFSDTLDISNNHVDCRLAVPFESFRYVIIDSPTGLADIEDYWLRVRWHHNTIYIYPLICPHEGAPLIEQITTLNPVNGCTIHMKCPWHGRKILPVAAIDLTKHDSIAFVVYKVRFIAALESRITTDNSTIVKTLRLYPKSPAV